MDPTFPTVYISFQPCFSEGFSDGFSEELLLAGLQPALTELFAGPASLHLAGALGDFGIRRLGEDLEQPTNSWLRMVENG